jgi:2C-methyl-D-erythritol 2,4-cyclodiphosphate synthase
MNFRIGEGWDVHALVPGRKLILGGIEVPHELGLALDQVNVKAKTAEKLGPVGQQQAMEARAAALLYRA